VVKQVEVVEPMNPVTELGDTSVSFKFDVRAFLLNRLFDFSKAYQPSEIVIQKFDNVAQEAYQLKAS